MSQNLKNKIEATDISISSLLKDQKFYIDYFQREYRWQEKHIKLLIEDLTTTFLKSYKPTDKRAAVANYQSYYLGPVVFSANTDNGKNSIIDGQQRITSITLFLIYLNNLQKEHSEKVGISDLIFSESYGEKSFNMTDEVADDFNLEELTKLYSMKDIESETSVLETAKLISDATKDKSWIKEKNNSEIDFNNKLEDIQYDVKLEDIYEKTYIMNEFIFYDDNITTIRNKISVSLALSEKFGSGIKFLPEYQYLWGEYDLEDKMDRIMLGQKWIRKNELLKIDIKPNENLSVYENLRNNLSYLKESFGIKIKREDDENLILRDYDDYINSNEIYLIDILNELGLNYSSSSDKKRNLYEVYVNIYFPFITFEHLEDIINLLEGSNGTKRRTFNYRT